MKFVAGAMVSGNYYFDSKDTNSITFNGGKNTVSVNGGHFVGAFAKIAFNNYFDIGIFGGYEFKTEYKMKAAENFTSTEKLTLVDSTITLNNGVATINSGATLSTSDVSIVSNVNGKDTGTITSLDNFAGGLMFYTRYPISESFNLGLNANVRFKYSKNKVEFAASEYTPVTSNANNSTASNDFDSYTIKYNATSSETAESTWNISSAAIMLNTSINFSDEVSLCVAGGLTYRPELKIENLNLDKTPQISYKVSAAGAAKSLAAFQTNTYSTKSGDTTAPIYTARTDVSEADANSKILLLKFTETTASGATTKTYKAETVKAGDTITKTGNTNTLKTITAPAVWGLIGEISLNVAF